MDPTEAVGILDDYIYVAQVGDSRAYLVREGQASQLTRDQSMVQALIDAGTLTEEEAETSGHRSRERTRPAAPALRRARVKGVAALLGSRPRRQASDPPFRRKLARPSSDGARIRWSESMFRK